jgi:Rad3-related DNA helicase
MVMEGSGGGRMEERNKGRGERKCRKRRRRRWCYPRVRKKEDEEEDEEDERRKKKKKKKEAAQKSNLQWMSSHSQPLCTSQNKNKINKERKPTSVFSLQCSVLGFSLHRSPIPSCSLPP